ncbi:MAG: hypothetical protein JWN69_1588 [Alphaproteobacteria bacterium]|nr:hypothetical protein [Alphaproteobacteria bacterium]
MATRDYNRNQSRNYSNQDRVRRGAGSDEHMSLLERIEEKLNRLLGHLGHDDGDRGDRRAGRDAGERDTDERGFAPESLVRGDDDDEPRLFGGPHIGAPGWDPSFPGPRFDRVDVGSTGTHGAHPISSFYGADYGIGATGSYGGSSARERALLARRQGQQQPPGQQHRDPHYSEWRERQIEQFDRDYHDYRSEQQQRFSSGFEEWRGKRQARRDALERVRPDMDVVGSNGQSVGKVAWVEGDVILLAGSGEAGGDRRAIPCGWIETVDVRVTLDRPAEEAQRTSDGDGRGAATGTAAEPQRGEGRSRSAAAREREPQPGAGRERS